MSINSLYDADVAKKISEAGRGEFNKSQNMAGAGSSVLALLAISLYAIYAIGGVNLGLKVTILTLPSVGLVAAVVSGIGFVKIFGKLDEHEKSMYVQEEHRKPTPHITLGSAYSKGLLDERRKREVVAMALSPIVGAIFTAVAVYAFYYLTHQGMPFSAVALVAGFTSLSFGGAGIGALVAGPLVLTEPLSKRELEIYQTKLLENSVKIAEMYETETRGKLTAKSWQFHDSL